MKWGRSMARLSGGVRRRFRRGGSRHLRRRDSRRGGPGFRRPSGPGYGCCESGGRWGALRGCPFNAVDERVSEKEGAGSPQSSCHDDVVVEWDGKAGGRMPPGMGAWQPERLRYGGEEWALCNQLPFAEDFFERCAVGGDVVGQTGGGAGGLHILEAIAGNQRHGAGTASHPTPGHPPE